MTHRPILFVDHADALGGAERSLLLLTTFLDRDRWQPHLIAPPGTLAEEAEAAGIPVHVQVLPRLRGSSRSLLDLWQQAVRISKTAREIGAVLVHSNTVRATAYAALAARLAALPFVWHMRDYWLSEAEPASKWPDRLGKFIFCRMATRVFAISHAVAGVLPCSANLSVLHNGIDLSYFDEAHTAAGNTASLRKAAGFPPQAQIVGMVGRARPLKGQHIFLQMAGQLRATAPRCRFLVVGGDQFNVGDDYEAHLMALSSQLGLDEQVHWTGQLDDVRPALEAMDIFVNPGVPEGFGLVNVEAMAMGKPVVAFDHGPLPEIVAHGETGLLVPPGDTAALAGAVARLLQDPAHAQRMGRAGRRRVENLFRIERTVNELEAHYQELVGTA
ncbi:MAG: glycosyltransferase family 4 protein [Caldilineaceae bacterium SB0661_bin_32]|uniref:Glycosyltransferase family 4 protein n=1 Tax=Caldilineaceae bacterium SB0661_bin_32 TaxID=2605255 RepID=A0A6B1D3X9_9CHLR|nr:glycosyltransferase family 4 protein [Caldilineaceae bacterium SB0661_bin_32]